VKLMMIKLEQTIINRCLESPFRKDVGINYPFFIGFMDNDCWEMFRFNQRPDTIKCYHRTVAVQGGTHKMVQFVSLQWKGTKTKNWPILYTRGWYLHKWINHGCPLRSIIIWIHITRNMDSGFIRSKFEYDIHDYDDNGWEFS